jgi:hypothetical protein
MLNGLPATTNRFCASVSAIHPEGESCSDHLSRRCSQFPPAREETAQAKVAAAAARQEADALRATAEQRRADLAVLRDEAGRCSLKPAFKAPAPAPAPTSRA